VSIRLFCGYDSREAIGFHVFSHSVIRSASKPIEIRPLGQMWMPEGSNAFTLSRFLVPMMCGWQGHAIFADACDMLCLNDIAELDALFDPAYAVQVVKHDSYKTQHRTKYRGSGMECPNMNYERKNWASLMLVNCEHPAWRINAEELLPSDLLTFKFLKDEEIGSLPPEWNRLVDEDQPHEDAKIAHWTAGVPAFDYYTSAPAADLWHFARREMNQVG
jgi:hypothetical protein